MGQIIKNKKFILLLVIIGILFTTSVASAELLVDWPPSPLGTPLTEESTFTDLIRYLYEWGISLGGLAVFIALLIAGFQYLISVGDPKQMKEAIDRIQSAVLGLVLLLGTFLILATINPALTVLRPLTLDLEAVEDAWACEHDDDCPENWQCKDNVCVPKMDVEPTQCESVTIIKDDGQSIDLKLGQKKEFEIGADTTFKYEASPDECKGVLKLYPGWFCWGGARHQIIIFGNDVRKASSPEITRCVALRRIPGF